MRRTARALAAVAALLTLAGCGEASSADLAAGSSPTASQEAHYHDLADDPVLEPAGDTGTAALSQPMASMDDLSAWVRELTGECADLAPASAADLTGYLGPVRVKWYEPFVAEWATCGIKPYERFGLVLFKPGQQSALQEFWKKGLASGEINDNPDWAFGNGFAITAGALGTARLGLHYLWCEPVDDPTAHIIPGDVDGCVYAAPDHH